MTSCSHSKLVLLPGGKGRLRCRHCHLTIGADELGCSYCPECFETGGTKRYEFDEVAAEETSIHRYRCEECGTVIETN
ncbi:MAG: hypothetical protein AMK71_00960 [Nitrospira bacterium SG8_35_4]|nr:MAG: hypothetical protein AMK71_00960 [Nitrospira bacterium SG8_35_4]